jgi:hypothetical protein
MAFRIRLSPWPQDHGMRSVARLSFGFGNRLNFSSAEGWKMSAPPSGDAVDLAVFLRWDIRPLASHHILSRGGPWLRHAISAHGWLPDHFQPPCPQSPKGK